MNFLGGRKSYTKKSRKVRKSHTKKVQKRKKSRKVRKSHTKKSRKGRGRSTRPNVDVLSTMFDQMKMGERKVYKEPKKDLDKLENLFSRLTPFKKKKSKAPKSKGTKASRRIHRQSKMASIMVD